MKRRFFIFALIFCVITTIMLTACGGTFVRDDKALRPSETEQNELKPFPVTIDGVIIEETPTGIVCLSPSVAEILFEFGYGDTLIGRSVYCDFPLGVNNAEIIEMGSDFDTEAIIRLAPDILILPDAITEKQRIILEKNAIKTLVIPSPKSFEELRGVYRTIGLILYGGFVGENEGDVLFSEISSAFNNEKEINLGNFIYITKNMLIATGDTLESSLLSPFGENLAKDSMGYSFDKEKLRNLDIDTLIINNEYSLDEVMEANEIISELKAVKDGRVIFLDNGFFERPTSRLIKLVSEIKSQYLLFKNNDTTANDTTI